MTYTARNSVYDTHQHSTVNAALPSGRVCLVNVAAYVLVVMQTRNHLTGLGQRMQARLAATMFLTAAPEQARSVKGLLVAQEQEAGVVEFPIVTRIRGCVGSRRVIAWRSSSSVFLCGDKRRRRLFCNERRGSVGCFGLNEQALFYLAACWADLTGFS